MRRKPRRGLVEEVDPPGICFSDTTNKESADGTQVPKTDTRRVMVATTSLN